MSRLPKICWVILSLAPLTLRGSVISGPLGSPITVPNASENSESLYYNRLEEEQRIQGELANWELKIEELREDFKSSPALSSRRKTFRNALLELRDKRAVVYSEFQDLKNSTRGWEYLHEQIQIELQAMNEIFDRVYTR